MPRHKKTVITRRTKPGGTPKKRTKIQDSHQTFSSHPGVGVWEFFELPSTPVEEQWVGRLHCSLCPSDSNKSFASSSSTSTLRRHLTADHAQNARVANLRDVEEKIDYSSSLPRQQYLDYLLAAAIIRDNHPLALVNGEGFREFCKNAAPDFTVPDRTTIRVYVQKICSHLRTMMKEVVSKLPSLSITIDGWKSRSGLKYLVVTGHWITPEWIARNCTLAVHPLSRRHTTANLADTAMQILGALGFDGQIVSKTNDNANNIVHAMRALEGTVVRCNAHLFNLVVKDTFKHARNTGLRDLAKRCRGLNRFCRKSNVPHKLREACKKVNLPETVKQAVPHRWNSFYDSLQRLLVLRNPLTKIFETMTMKKRRKFLTPDEWRCVEQLVHLFDPVNDGSKTLSAVCHPTISLVHLVWATTMKRITTFMASESLEPLVIAAGQVMNECFQDRFDLLQFSDLLQLALALDPRTKDMIYLSEDTQQRIWETLLAHAEELHRPKVSPHPTNPLLDPLLMFVAKHDLQSRIKAEVALWKSQLSIELRTPVPGTEGVYQYPNVLEFWKNQSQNFPLLSPIARKVLAVPATSVPSERVGSVAGNIVRARRSRLCENLISDLTFGTMNCHFLGEAQLDFPAINSLSDEGNQREHENENLNDDLSESLSESLGESEVEKDEWDDESLSGEDLASMSDSESKE